MSVIKQKLAIMLQVQETLNQSVNPEWREAGYRWEDALTVEGVELMDHLPWKWWKAPGSLDIEQIQLEAVDIWHFIMSRLLQEDDIEEIIGNLHHEMEHLEFVLDTAGDMDEILDSIRNFIHDVSAENVNHIPGGYVDATQYTSSFFAVLMSLGMTLDDLYILYIAKTQLNRLRWANGYGTDYIKVWDGEEDNVWLMRLVNTLDVDAPDFLQQVYDGLCKRYAEVKEKDTMEKCNGK